MKTEGRRKSIAWLRKAGLVFAWIGAVGCFSTGAISVWLFTHGQARPAGMLAIIAACLGAWAIMNFLESRPTNPEGAGHDA